MDPTEIEFIWRLGNSIGVVSVLMLGIWLGVKGHVVTRKTHEDVTDAQSKATEMLLQGQKQVFETTAKVIGHEIREGMKEAVSDGVKEAIVQGFLEIKQINGSTIPTRSRRKRS